MNSSIFRTQSNNVQIIKIIPSSETQNITHRNITKVTLGETNSGSRNSVTTRDKRDHRNPHLQNEMKLDQMKTTILRMKETKDSAIEENTTLRRSKSLVDKLKQENIKLQTMIENLNSNNNVTGRVDEEFRRRSPDGTENREDEADGDLAKKVELYEEDD